MRSKIFAPLLMLMLLIGATGVTLAQDKKDKNRKESVLFEVSLHCENCQKKIERNIPYEKGVTDLKVNLEEKTVWVEYKPAQTTVDKLSKAIEKLGYEVTVYQPQTNKEK